MTWTHLSSGLPGFGLCGLFLHLFQGWTSSMFTMLLALLLALLLGAVLGWAAAAPLLFLARRDANTLIVDPLEMAD